MKISQVAHRYARAVYELAVETGNQDKVFTDLRHLEPVFEKDKEIHDFLTNPLVDSSVRAKALEAALDSKNVSKEAHDLILLLAKRERIGVFKEIVAAYEEHADSANEVCRGTVRSAANLDQDERKRIEATVEKVLNNKKVIMTYKVDPEVIGGLIAQVGSYTFDDTIASHLRRMNEELKRRTV
jgi:F-type H+-transporting ATPase subunit delta